MASRPFAVLGLFPTPDALLAAARSLKGRPGATLEAYTPWPVHGLPEALGLRRSPLPGMVFVAGTLGAAAALFLQWWLSARDYPIVTGGKHVESWQAFVPILFEVTVLFATLTAGLGMLLLLNRLPSFGHPVLASGAIRAITRDRFALALEARGEESLDVESCRAALREAGASEIEVVPFPEPAPRALPAEGYALLAVLALLAPVLAGAAAYAAVKAFPTLPPMRHMLFQPRLDAQDASAFFADGRGGRAPAPGAVARGRFALPARSTAEIALRENPLPRDAASFSLGRARYDIHCALCHGALGDGKSHLTPAYGAKPASFHTERLRGATDGELEAVVASGLNAMPGYARDLAPDERWAVVLHLRALQRAQSAKEEDLR